MADLIRGTIQQIPKPREFVKGNKTTYYYSVKVNDVYYSVGTRKPPEEGTLIEFQAEKNARGYWDAVKDTLRVVQAQEPTQNVASAAVASASNSKMTKDDYFRRKEERDIEKDQVIQLQSCRNSAIEFVKLLATPFPVEDKDGNPKAPIPALKLPKDIAKREAVLFEAVKRYTQEFVSENNSSEKNNKNEQLPQDEAPSKDSESVASDDAAWDV